MDVQISNIHEKTKKHRNIAESMPFLPALSAAALRLLYGSCRIEIAGEENYLASKDIHPWIGVGWHFTFLSLLYFFRDLGYLTIASRSRDGDFAAGLVKGFGWHSFRGSPKKGGVAALKGIISAFCRSPGGGFIADGSQGRH